MVAVIVNGPVRAQRQSWPCEREHLERLSVRLSADDCRVAMGRNAGRASAWAVAMCVLALVITAAAESDASNSNSSASNALNLTVLAETSATFTTYASTAVGQSMTTTIAATTSTTPPPTSTVVAASPGTTAASAVALPPDTKHFVRLT